MKKTIFEGIGTALVTPMTHDGIDYESFGRLVEWQITEGVDALIVCGTTGEASTMTDDEHRDAITFVVDKAAGRVPVIAGVGSNDTAYALDLTRHACADGADAVLSLTPYYNKCTQNGLIKMFSQIADTSTVPVVLYNVPGRTGINIEPSTYEKLADHGNIVAIKEANGLISKIVETFARVDGKLDIYSGNDDQIVPIMAMGGKGCISVLSNVVPRQAHELCARMLRGDTAGAAALQCHYQKLIDALFTEVNPIPVKAAMAAMGYCSGYLREPLTELEDGHKEVLFKVMRAEGLIV